jgi:hypothetical protein
MRSYRVLSAILVLSASISLMGRSTAFDLKEMTLDEKVSHSSIVVVGHVLSTQRGGDAPETQTEYATIRVETVLKGRPPLTFQFLTRGFVAESNPLCCQVGSKYLFFLERRNDGRYASVNGRYGVYLIN